MRNEALRDLVKVWLYAMAAILLAAAAAPWLWNIGMGLAEVTAGKQTNGVVEWAAAGCRRAVLADYFRVAWGVAAVVLLGPLLGWLKLGPGAPNRAAPWSLQLPNGGRTDDGGQRLRFGLGASWQGLVGLALGLLLMAVLGVLAVASGAFRWVGGIDRFAAAAGWLLPWAAGWAVAQELLFRGVALGVFLRSMRAAMAILLAALLFALARYGIAAAGGVTVDPESAGAGIELLGGLLKRLAEPRVVVAELLPALALGCLLGYARWRTAELWLPVGLHMGWLVAQRGWQAWMVPLNPQLPAARMLLGEPPLTGLALPVLLILAGLAVRLIISKPEEDADGGE